MDRLTRQIARSCALLATCWLAQACGSESTRSAPLEFTAQHAALFDDGVDLIEDPEGLQGRWRTDWEADVDARIIEADWVATGKVSTVHVEIDPEGRSNYHVQFDVVRRLKGKPPDDQVSLASRERAAGYSSLAQHRHEMLEREFIAFVRYAAGTGVTATVPHFHLMPPSPGVTRAVERYEAKRNPHRIQVIEHKQD